MFLEFFSYSLMLDAMFFQRHYLRNRLGSGDNNTYKLQIAVPSKSEDIPYSIKRMYDTYST